MDNVISFRMPSEKAAILDNLAKLQRRDRSFILNEAVDYYLDLNQHHLELIQEGLRQADAGQVISQKEVDQHIAELIAKSKRH